MAERDKSIKASKDDQIVGSGAYGHRLLCEADGAILGVEAKAAKILLKLGNDVEHLYRPGTANQFTGGGMQPEWRRADMEKQESLRNIKRGLSKPDHEDNSAEGHWLVDSVSFNACITFTVVLNTLEMGVETDYPEWTTAWAICEYVFTTIFLIEMIIKLIVLRWKYFHDKANLLDGGLAMLGVLDTFLLSIISNGSDLQNFSILRLLRLLRLARILRLVRRVKPLVLVIQGVVHALCTSVYVFAVCIFIFYVFSIFLTEHLGKSESSSLLYPGYSTDPAEIDEQDVMGDYNPHVCFGSVLSSMLTLFNMATFTEWGEIVRPIKIKQPEYLLVFLFFALTVGFGVMNVLIGVIVDVVTEESRRLETAFQDKEKKEKLQTLTIIEDMLAQIDENNDEFLDLEELAHALKGNERLAKLLTKINLPSGWSSDELLAMLDNNGDGVLTHAEFATSFFRLLDSDDFQQICILQSSINQVKHLLRDQTRHFGEILSNLQEDTALLKEGLGFVIERQSTEEDETDQGNKGKRTAAEIKKVSAQYACRKPGQAQGDQVRKVEQLVRETIQEQFEVLKSCLASELRCSMPDRQDVGAGVRSVNDFKSVLPESAVTAVAHAIDEGAISLDSVDASDKPLLEQDMGRVSEHVYSAVPDGDTAAAFSSAALIENHTVAVESQTSEVLCPEEYAFLDFAFEDSARPLGFTIHWVEDLPPLIGGVVLGGAANMQGVLEGDRLMECNGVKLAGKDRQEVLQLLGSRPLVLRVLRE